MVVMILTPYYIYVNIVVICKLYGCTKGLQIWIKKCTIGAMPKFLILLCHRTYGAFFLQLNGCSTNIY